VDEIDDEFARLDDQMTRDMCRDGLGVSISVDQVYDISEQDDI
jgi:hypothetical protein